MRTLLINFKTYKEATGDNALKLAKICEEVQSKYSDAEIIVSPQLVDMQSLSKMKIKLFAQHMDAVEPGKATGHVTPFAIANLADGTMLNHSEKKMSLDDVGSCVKLAREYLLEVLCFAKDLEEAKSLSQLEPDYIAYEPPELVGGKVSVSEAEPEMIEKFVRLVKKLKPDIKALCGAGINKPEDVRKALELGAEGIALSSAFVKSSDSKKFLEDLVQSLV